MEILRRRGLKAQALQHAPGSAFLPETPSGLLPFLFSQAIFFPARNRGTLNNSQLFGLKPSAHGELAEPSKPLFLQGIPNDQAHQGERDYSGLP
jgi:hypothetical protein